jgi:hypothetical protein
MAGASVVVLGQVGEIVRGYAAKAQSSTTFANRSNSRRRVRAEGAQFVRVCCVVGRFAASIASCGPILRGYASLKPERGGP